MVGRLANLETGCSFAPVSFSKTIAIATMALAAPALAAPPTVMSLNVCTDQLAMLLAAPGQLVSVSFMADDPSLSFLHEEATGYPENFGNAEEVLLRRPDTVVTSQYTLQNAASEMLRGLGFRVEEFAFAQTLDTIPGEIRRMGEILAAEDRAERIAQNFETELAAIEARQCEVRPTAIAWGQNGVAAGAGTLADSVMQAAGVENLAAKLGVYGMAPFPLELLVEHRPDIVILPEAVSGAPSLADRAVEHPALRALHNSRKGSFVPDGSWSCAGPFTLEAVRALKHVRDEVAPCEAEK